MQNEKASVSLENKFNNYKLKKQKLLENKINQLNFNGQKVFIGLDVHLKSWKATIMLEETPFKTFSQNPCAATLRNYLDKNFPNGEYYSAYEAGFCGFSVHRELLSCGIRGVL